MAQTKSDVLDELTSQVNKDELVEIVGSKRLERGARLGASARATPSPVTFAGAVPFMSWRSTIGSTSSPRR